MSTLIQLKAFTVILHNAIGDTPLVWAVVTYPGLSAHQKLSARQWSIAPASFRSVG